MSDPIRDAITRAIIETGDELLSNQTDADGPFNFYEAVPVLPQGKTREQMIEELAKSAGVSIEAATEAYKHGLDDVRIAKSSQFQVAVHEGTPNGFGEPMVHLSIKRLDREPIRDWRELQQIKNAIVGEESEAFEIYPAESRLVDSANQYHLWCFRPGFKIPIGFDTRLVAEYDGGITGSKQRPFKSPDATLPSRAQFAASLRNCLNWIENRDVAALPQVRAEARALLAQFELVSAATGEAVMSSRALVREDGRGLFVRAGGYVARPGDVSGYAHAYTMSDGGLKAGDRVKAHHISQTPLTKLTLDDGRIIHWHHSTENKS